MARNTRLISLFVSLTAGCSKRKTENGKPRTENRKPRTENCQMRRVYVFVMMLWAVQLVSAQIRIIPQKQLEAANPQVAASSPLQFVPCVVDFGTIEEMSGVWQGSAKLENTGADTIVLTQIKTTCGCLKAEVQQRVLAPKESIVVALKYYPRGHAGRVMQRVLIYTNRSVDQPSAILQLKGDVTASADRSDDYPYTRGTLRLRQDVVRLESMQRQIMRVACMNGGSTTLRPGVDTLLTTKGLKVRFEPAVLAPKQEGDMVVEYVPQTSDSAKKEAKIYLKIAGVSPRNGVVDVLFDKK